MMLTDNQRKALGARGSLSVTANAGAGKTKVLVERFIDVLLTSATRVTEIVAITFTEKAASELRRKISSSLAERIRGERDRERREKLEYIRDNLPSSPIGTIHSFCARLLREYPVEADVDAGFTILEGHDRDVAESEALRSTLNSVLAATTPSRERNDMLEVLRMLGRKTVESHLRDFLEHREVVERVCTGPLAENRTDGEILEAWKASITSYVADCLESPRWRDAMSALLVDAKGALATEGKEGFARWTSPMTMSDKVELYGRLSELVFTKNGEPRASSFRRRQDEMKKDPSFVSLRKFDAAIADLVRDMRSADFDPANSALLKVDRVLLRLYTKFVESYDARKAEQGQLDFDDLERKTIGVLNNPTVRTHAASRYRYVMVDEFQDTNFSQYRILNLLLSGFSGGNLFIVGDPKQSIYGFRNADVEIFRRTTHELAHAADSDNRDGVVLPESFRLLSGIILFINKIFSHIMKDEPGIGYDPLIRGRQNDAPGIVELMILPASGTNNGPSEESGEEEESGVEKECLMIARRLLKLRNESHLVFRPTDGGEAPAPFRYSDAAILLRSRTNLKALEEALIGCDIPYVIASGIGYYQTQEIFDFLNYFKFLVNPHDDVALLGILRSPFFVIADAELFELSVADREDSLWKKIIKRRSPSPGVRRAIEILSADLRTAQTVPVPMLIQRIVGRTAWGGSIAGLAQGRQYKANVEKLTGLARSFESQGYVMLFDFVQRLQALIHAEAREGQAMIESERDAVRIMTIHSAKGLEFPVVFVPFIHSRIKPERKLFLDPEIGISLPTMHPADFDKEYPAPLVNFLSIKQKRKALEEEKRIFYVACTRARDALILSGVAQDPEGPPTWMRWLGEGVRTGAVEQTPELLKFMEPLSVLEKTESGYIAHTSEAELAVSILSPEKVFLEPEGESSVIAAHIPPPALYLKAPVGTSAGEFYSATHIRTYTECPAKYYLKICLGLPEERALPYPFDAEEDPNDLLRGEAEGTITHAVLQRAFTAPFDEAKARSTARALLGSSAGLAGEELDEMERRISHSISAFARSPFGVEVLGGSAFETEFTLSARFGDNFLTGTIDRLWREKDGTWSIIDYKTDNIPKSEIKVRARTYAAQVEVYAYLVGKYFQQPRVGASVLFLRHPEDPVHMEFSQDELQEIGFRIGETISKIRAGTFETGDVPCSTCTYSTAGRCLLQNRKEPLF